jgi:replicative DNA helicase
MKPRRVVTRALETRSSPQSLEAERAVLGGLLLLAGAPTDHDLLRELCEGLRAEHFYSSDHGRLFALIAERAKTAAPLDVLGLADHIMTTETAVNFGGLTYATSLPEQVPTTENLDYYAGIVREKAARREVLDLANELRAGAVDGTELEIILSRAKVGLDSLDGAGGERVRRDTPVLDTVSRFMTRIDEEQSQLIHGDARVVTYGFEALDKFGPPLPGDLVIIGGRPAMGKTQLMLQALVHMAQQGKEMGLPGVVYVCSLEMGEHQLMARIISSLSGVPYKSILNPRLRLTDDQYRAVTEWADWLATLPIVVNDQPARTIESVRASAIRLRRRHGGMLAIGLDYLQLAGTDEDTETRAREVAFIAQGAKEIAKTVHCPFLLAAQLNRGVEARADKRPFLSDIGEGGGIEAAADQVVFLYRDDYYHADSPNPGKAEVLCAKMRNGETGKGILNFEDGVFSDVIDYTGEDYGRTPDPGRQRQRPHRRRPASRGHRPPHPGGAENDD